MKIAVFNKEGKETGRQVEFSEELFASTPNEHVVYLDIKQYLANQRQGTHKVKNRNEVAGSTRKIKKQKGTGGARAGSIKSPTIRGGGTMFGPVPRDYSFKVNKKVKKLAKRSVFASKAQSDSIKVLEDFSVIAPKTKEMVGLLNNLSLANSKTLFIAADRNDNIYLSARNIPNAAVITVDEITSYDVVNADMLVVFESAVEPLHNRLN